MNKYPNQYYKDKTQKLVFGKKSNENRQLFRKQ